LQRGEKNRVFFAGLSVTSESVPWYNIYSAAIFPKVQLRQAARAESDYGLRSWEWDRRRRRKRSEWNRRRRRKKTTVTDDGNEKKRMEQKTENKKKRMKQTAENGKKKKIRKLSIAFALSMLLTLALASGCAASVPSVRTGSGSRREGAGQSVTAGKTETAGQSGTSAGMTVEKAAPEKADPEKTAPGKDDPEKTAPGKAGREDPVEITFTAVGDNLINEVLYEQAADRAAAAGAGEDYDFAPCYAQISPFIKEHDVNWIDIETLMTDTCEPSGYPAFSTPGASGRALYDAGWRVFSLCSNHTYDLGTVGIRETLAFWDGMKKRAEAGRKTHAPARPPAEGLAAGPAEPQAQIPDSICCTGLWEKGREDRIPILTCKGKKLAFLTYTYGTNDIPTPDDAPAHVIYLEQEDLMAYQIGLARERADAVIVSLHWGEEYNHRQTDEQRALAQRVADMGADLIIGGHPHVVEGAEMLTAADGRKVFCAYSLGNFICAQNAMPDPDAMIGLLLSCTFRFDDDGLSVEDHALVPIVTDYGKDYADDHVVLYRDYSEEDALAHGMRDMFGFTQFDHDYVADMLTGVVGPDYLQLP